MSESEPILINVDRANPGQFFACCGLLELANRLWGGAEGWFSGSGAVFFLRRQVAPNDRDKPDLINGLGACRVSSTMTEDEISRLKKLLNQKKTTLTDADNAEKQRLSELWSRERITFHEPFNLRVDWWGDQHSGGADFKTWAGKQFVIDLVRGLQIPLRSKTWSSLVSERWLFEQAHDGHLPLYFDADIGAQSSSIDVGFSLDSLDMRSQTKPLTELAAFVGLQRFRPRPNKPDGLFCYVPWTEPFPPLLASVACSGLLPQPLAQTYEFRLLYRTKYLKGFLPAKPKGDEL
jgi:CRISPR-associated protein Csb3